MLKELTNYFHHLFNPHCPICKLEQGEKLDRELEARTCKSCESLKDIINSLTSQNQKLLDSLISKEIPTQIQEEELKIELPRRIPFHVRRQMLERADREAANIRLKERQVAEENMGKPDAELTEKLEAELLEKVDSNAS